MASGDPVTLPDNLRRTTLWGKLTLTGRPARPYPFFFPPNINTSGIATIDIPV